MDPTRFRQRALRRAEAWLLARDLPRLHMLLIIWGTGMAGFLFSFLLLRAGLSAMWLRYPLAVGLAYGVFLVLLRMWLSYQESRQTGSGSDGDLDIGQPSLEDFRGLGRGSDIGGSGGSGGGDGWGVLDPGDAVWLLVILAALASVVLICGYVIWTAPGLLAEVLVDGLIMARFYRRLRTRNHSHWIDGALRRTWFPAASVGLLFALAGYAMHKLVPTAESIGPVFAYIVERFF